MQRIAKGHAPWYPRSQDSAKHSSFGFGRAHAAQAISFFLTEKERNQRKKSPLALG
ncbi:hypothetical protein U6B65_10790 [Oscillospiraceae bacterium MB08-C2-2]|nr:hypothetical protein U6B65_10790 [Oscillospiraceae bacterium MB08-C2-2]